LFVEGTLIIRHSYTYIVGNDILLALHRLVQTRLKLVTSPEGTLSIMSRTCCCRSLLRVKRVCLRQSHDADRTTKIGLARYGLFSKHVASNLKFRTTYVSDDNIVLISHFRFFERKAVYYDTIAQGSVTLGPAP